MARGRPLPHEQQVAIFRRDRWLCRWCGKPVIFAPALKYLERDLRERGYKGKLAYFQLNFTRHGAPLLDELAVVLDHVEAAARGGANGSANLVTACNKCNMKKSDLPLDKWNEKHPAPKPIRSKYGEPEDWDGFSSLFVMLAERFVEELTPSERNWLSVLKHG
jgi:5-methylcytosine-specific restriction endonuclease McrA